MADCRRAAVADGPRFHPAAWWEPATGAAVACRLCPRECLIPAGGSGFCGIRRNVAGRLFAVAYGRPVALQVDPIEKKPLAEFQPGTLTFSLGTYGCNLACAFCQNHHLSCGRYTEAELARTEVEPAVIVDAARRHGCSSVAFTYNEPLVWGEYVMAVAGAARAAGLATVLVSNGYVNPVAAAEIFPLIDAANIDLKGCSEAFYQRLTGGRLAPVQAAAKAFFAGGGHLELTNLVIPGQNDSPEMIAALVAWVREELSPEVPIHFSAYHPDHRYHASPPTPAASLYRIRDAAHAAGLRRVYLGNIR